MNTSIIIFDTETTGLPRAEIVSADQQPEIIEFAAIKLDSKTFEEIDRIEFKCKPSKPLSKKITEITGLVDADLKDSPKFAAKYPELATFFLNCEYAVAHNIQFDNTLLYWELKRMKSVLKFPWAPKQICTINQTMSITGYRLNLTKLHKHLFGVDFTEKHRAMGDVEALTRCFKELVSKDMIKM